MLEIIREYGLLFLIGQYPHGPIGGLAGTLGLAIMCLALALPCSVLIAVARISQKPYWRWLSGSVVYIMRGTPFLMIVFWSYYLLPILTGHAVNPFWVMVVALVLYESAYLAEVIRAGIQALPHGQFEGAKALGFPKTKTMVLIILPQALYNSFPALLSQFVSIIKETSLGLVIGVQEFTFAASQANASLMVQPVEVFSILGITFFILCFAFTSAARLLERRIGKSRGVAAA
ncbi:amino acid ABC transporter permease [Rhizobium leguminosarum]|uniref:amino acid ABC transporter permease n=1 Tax=Rhizobium leguminosarum TaxID=384 RepID=UPI000FEC54AB|nr:amino acid ABC transporter permease [Rhizobium leguminosarum]RWX35220.1 amino acid ABC transporter permease [Rhizobium leguminosarum]